ncbi:RNA-directed DNA polymerase, eukaryota, partial [Tanacetum coccineum]
QTVTTSLVTPFAFGVRKNGAHLTVVGHGRDVANAKYSDWVISSYAIASSFKGNIFVWRARRDCLPTRSNLEHRGVDLVSSNCPICHDFDEDIKHILFRCDLAQCVLRRVCRWWNLDPQEWSSFLEWQTWFLSLRLASKNKDFLEGVFYVAW